MGDLMKLAKVGVMSAVYYRYALSATLLVGAVAFAFGDGGTFTVSWIPAQEV